MAGKQKAVYVQDGPDAELWDRAVEYARERRMSISGLVLLALQEKLEREAT
jgi:hypothetical protein